MCYLSLWTFDFNTQESKGFKFIAVWFHSNQFSVLSCELDSNHHPHPTPYLPSSITVDGLVQILPLRWMNSLSLDPMRCGTSHTTCNKTIDEVRAHKCTHFISHPLELIYTSRRNPVHSGWKKARCLQVASWCFDTAAFLLQWSRIGNEERQFVGEQQVVGLIAHGAGWRESVLLSVECLLHWQSSSPDKEQQ